MRGDLKKRDEVERAIAAVVANIDGVSDRVIDGLDEEFGTAKNVARASPNELQRVDGIGTTLSRRIYRRTNSALKNPGIHQQDIYCRDLR